MNIGAICSVLFLLCFLIQVKSDNGGLISEGGGGGRGGSGGSSYGTVAWLVKKEERMPILSTEFGAISAVNVGDGTGRHNYHLQFITLEPNALFLPVLLHADMVFYVKTGSGTLSWTDAEDDEQKKIELKRGDVYSLKTGALFYLQSSLETERHRLRIIAIFANSEDGDELLQDPRIGPYSSINDLIRGFDKKVLQAAFQVPEEMIEEITSVTDTPAIVHAETKKKKNFWEANVQFANALLGIKSYDMEAAENSKKHPKAFNFYKEDPDFKNCYGWSTVVTNHDLKALRGYNMGVFMVNLTKGAMMGPHWNPRATEISVVLEGEGMVRVVCSSTSISKECKNTWFRVEESDVFTVPRFHPMAQTSFNNGSLVFMGFSTAGKKNHPQFLAGKASILQTLDKRILEASFNVSNTTIDKLLDAQDSSIILECTSCAEEGEVLMEQEIEQERQKEEARKREEEETRRREEEERRRKEEQRRQEEEQRRQEEEERKRREEEEERKRREEEKERKRAEEEARTREEEEEQRRREEEERRRHEGEEEWQKEEEEKRRREEEERRREEEERQQQEERQRREEEQRRREEEQERRQEEAAAQKKEEEEAREREEEQQRRQEEEAAQQREEEEAREREEEQQRRQEEEAAQQREEEEAREREEQQRRQEEEEAQQREEEQRRREEEQRRQEEEEWRREERGRGEEEEEEEEEETEEEAARREEEERREWGRRGEERGTGWRALKLKLKEQKRQEKQMKGDIDQSSSGIKREGRRVLRRVVKV